MDKYYAKNMVVGEMAAWGKNKKARGKREKIGNDRNAQYIPLPKCNFNLNYSGPLQTRISLCTLLPLPVTSRSRTTKSLPLSGLVSRKAVKEFSSTVILSGSRHAAINGQIINECCFTTVELRIRQIFPWIRVQHHSTDPDPTFNS